MEKRTKLLLRILSVLVFIIIGYNVFSYNYGEPVPMGYGCHYEKAVLLNQYIDNTAYSGGGDCLDGCLFMDVYTEHFTFLSCGHIDKIEWVNKTYFFANELQRNDLNNGDNIIVEWCYVNRDIGKRIKSVKLI